MTAVFDLVPQMMRYVFRVSPHVLIWMGIPSEHLGFMLATGWIDRISDSWIENPEDTEKALLELLRTPWWQRLWVLQEVLLPRSASMFFGSLSFGFRDFIRSMRHLHVTTYKVPRRRLANSSFPAFQRAVFENIWAFRAMMGLDGDTIRLDSPGGNPFNTRTVVDKPKELSKFIEIIALARFQLTTDPRDKLFGLLGLIDGSLAILLQPRYDEPVLASYCRTTATIMRASRSLKLLEHVFPQKRSSELQALPSWVPDYSAEFSRYDRLWILKQRYMDQRRQTVTPAHADIRIQDDQVLQVKGVLVDTVIQTSSVIDYYSFDPSTLENCPEALVQSWDPVLLDYLGSLVAEGRHIGKTRDTPSPSSAALAILLNKEHPEIANPFDALDYVGGGSILSAYRDTILQGLAPTSLRSSVTAGRRDIFSKNAMLHLRSTPGMDWNEYLHDMVAHIQDAVMGRQLFITTDGFFGSAQHVVVGDKVFVLDGSRLPVILRPSSTPARTGHYTFVGCCYVPGIMDGQAWSRGYASKRGRGLARKVTTWDKWKAKFAGSSSYRSSAEDEVREVVCIE